jgi:hypothetical protein
LHSILESEIDHQALEELDNEEDQLVHSDKDDEEDYDPAMGNNNITYQSLSFKEAEAMVAQLSAGLFCRDSGLHALDRQCEGMKALRRRSICADKVLQT